MPNWSGRRSTRWTKRENRTTEYDVGRGFRGFKENPLAKIKLAGLSSESVSSETGTAGV